MYSRSLATIDVYTYPGCLLCTFVNLQACDLCCRQRLLYHQIKDVVVKLNLNLHPHAMHRALSLSTCQQCITGPLPTHSESLYSATEEWTICSLLEGCVQQAASHGHQLPRHTSGTLPGVVAAQSTAVLTGGQVVTPPCLACSKGDGGKVLLPLQTKGSWAKLRSVGLSDLHRSLSCSPI